MSFNLKAALEENEKQQKYIPEGWHRCRVTDRRLFKANSGTDGVEYALEDELGRTGKVGFYLTDKSLWRIGRFAKAAGVSEHTLDKFELEHVVGKYVDVLFAKGDRYVEPVNWEPAGTKTNDAPKPEAQKKLSDAPVAQEEPIPF